MWDQFSVREMRLSKLILLGIALTLLIGGTAILWEFVIEDSFTTEVLGEPEGIESTWQKWEDVFEGLLFGAGVTLVLGYLLWRSRREQVRIAQEVEKRRAAEAELRKARDDLEEQVKQRTSDLEREVGERLRAEQQLRARETQLIHMNRLSTMGELAITLAHEVSQPVFAINGYAGACIRLLQSETDQRDQLNSSVSKILGQTKRVQDVLGQARARLQPSAPTVMSTDLNALTRETAALTELERLKHGVALEMELAEDLPNVSADATQLQQVLMNLVQNAIEAMTEHATPDKRLWISTARNGAEAVDITVRDNGPGLTDSMIERVFEPFHTTKPQGLGMGLAISRSIVEAVDGQLWASSDGANGTTLHVRLSAEA